MLSAPVAPWPCGTRHRLHPPGALRASASFPIRRCPAGAGGPPPCLCLLLAFAVARPSLSSPAARPGACSCSARASAAHAAGIRGTAAAGCSVSLHAGYACICIVVQAARAGFLLGLVCCLDATLGLARPLPASVARFMYRARPPRPSFSSLFFLRPRSLSPSLNPPKTSANLFELPSFVSFLFLLFLAFFRCFSRSSS